MRKCVSCLAVVSLVACSGTSSGTGDSQSSSSGGGSSSVGGTLNGQSFSALSGYAHDGKGGGLDLILSNQASVCQTVIGHQIRAGEVIVQLYGMQGTAPGDFTTPEVKYAAVKSTCASGAGVEANVAGASRSTSAKVHIDAFGATVKGTVEISFADGSHVSGSFDVPTCAAEDLEGATCT